jgi:rubredoxin/mono/diheme cytochrome c family protein
LLRGRIGITCEALIMARYECSVCGYVHNESKDGSWDSLPDDWTCPVCAAAKSEFQLIGDQPQAVAAEAPMPAASPTSRAIFAHRVFGYVFLGVFVVLAIQMLPRLWTYQIEFPARTVVHISLGMAIGVVLILKIAVVRFFRRLDQSLVPALGTFLLVGSVVLIGISVPSAFREAWATGRLFAEENRQRVSTLLAQTGLPEEQCSRLTTAESLRTGQRILRQECIECHDLRTVLAKPRTPSSWRQTVGRMADRTTMLDPLDENEQLQVTAYLVALSPDLRKSAKQLRESQQRRNQSLQAAGAIAAAQPAPAGYDPAAAKALFEDKCSQCHETALVDDLAPSGEKQVRQLVASMVDQGLEATQEELALIVRYLVDAMAKRRE